MSGKCDLPADEQRDGKYKEPPGIRFHHKEERCEHHRIIPVVDPAGTAAFIFQKPCLERAEEQDSDHVADRISATDQQHDPVIEYACQVESSEYAVKTDPDQQDQNGTVVIGNRDLCLA